MERTLRKPKATLPRDGGWKPSRQGHGRARLCTWGAEGRQQAGCSEHRGSGPGGKHGRWTQRAWPTCLNVIRGGGVWVGAEVANWVEGAPPGPLILVPSAPGCTTLSQSLDFSGSQFPPL